MGVCQTRARWYKFMTMFLDTIARHSHNLTHKIAIDFSGEPPVTYGALAETVTRTGNYLVSLGIEPGDRVAVQLPKCLPFIYLHLASIEIGAIFLPLNPAYPMAELRYFLADSGARCLFAESQKRVDIQSILPELPDLERPVFISASEKWESRVGAFASQRAAPLPSDPDQTAMMLYTSGTTSRPKGAQITHGNLTANIESLHEAWGWRDDDVLLHVLPLFHVHGLVVALHGALHAGATAFLLPSFDAAGALELLCSGRFSVFMAVPTMHRRLYQLAGERRFDLSHLRLMTSGSDRLPDDLFFGYQRSLQCHPARALWYDRDGHESVESAAWRAARWLSWTASSRRVRAHCRTSD